MKHLWKLVLCVAAVSVTSLVVALDDISLPPGGDFYGVGGGATMTTTGALTTGGNLTVAGTVSATGAITGVPVDTGANVANVSTDADTYPQIVKKVITCAGTNVALEDSKADGNGVKVLDCEEEAFTLLGAKADGYIINNGAFNASANDLFYFSVGTAAAADNDADLTGTEADIIPKTTLDTASGTETTNTVAAILASPAIFDGTGTAKDVYVNFSVADACSSGPVTNKFVGTITLWYLKQGDH